MKIDEITRIGSFLSAYILLCASTKVYIFYKQFDIQIFDYIELSEILTLFINDIVNMSPFLFIALILNIFIIPEKYKDDIHSSSLVNLERHDRVFIYVKDFFNSRIGSNEGIIPISIFLFFMSSFLYAFINGIDLYLGVPIYFIFLISTLIICIILYIIYRELYLHYTNKNNIKFSPIYIVTLSLIVFIFPMTIITSYIQASKAKTSTFHSNIILFSEHSKIHINNKYIGQTKKYAFFYDPDSMKTHIYKLDNISHIEVSKYPTPKRAEKRQK